MNRLAAAQLVWDYMAPPEYDESDFDEQHVHNMTRDDESDVIWGHDLEWAGEIWFCTDCDYHETRNARKVK